MSVAANAFVCRELRLRQFRNFPELNLTLPAAGAAVIGDNGAGKTNLLEALYYLEIFRSFRGAADEQLVRFGAEAFNIRGTFENPATGVSHEISAGYEPRTRRKRITVDGSEPERLGEAIGHVGAVIFAPSDLALVAGPPGERRRFLDIVLSLAERDYLTALQRYRQVLRQRNALLKRGAHAAALGPWDEALVEFGSRVTTARAKWITASTTGFSDRYLAIGGTVAARLSYRPGIALENASAVDAGEVATAFRAHLDRVGPRERERAMTLAGPHRDELAIHVEGPDGSIELRDYGSGGQMRTAAIALRMVEADTIRAARGRTPMILLDDVFAELDAGRSRRILQLLDVGERGQVILTAPKESDIELKRSGGFVSSLVPWRIDAGRINAAGEGP
jgi:DNA replication and repair protein RecF